MSIWALVIQEVVRAINNAIPHLPGTTVHCVVHFLSGTYNQLVCRIDIPKAIHRR